MDRGASPVLLEGRRGLVLFFASVCTELLLLQGCRSERDSLVSRAQFGILYGGQIQEREAFPFELDRTKQQQGFRLEFKGELERPVPVRWEIDMPASNRARKSGGRLVRVGEATARPGQRRFEQLISFEPEHALGTWNLRVLVDGQLVLDRAFLVADERALREARQDGGA